MIEFSQVTKQYGAQVVLRNASFRVGDGEHVGIVGPNGAGKSTLFALISDEITPDGGRVTLPRDCRMGYLRQIVREDRIDAPLLEYVENAIPALRDLQAEMETLEEAFQAGTVAHREQALRRLGNLQTDFEAQGGYHLKTRAEVALGGLGFPAARFRQPLREFSGGWRMRAELARALIADPDVLLLDEPSNYLDIPAVEWLRKFLSEFAGSLLLISHDRYLLNSLTAATIEVANAMVTRYSGPYDYYVRERRLRYEQSAAARKNQDRKREQMERFVERFKAKNTFASRAKSVARKLEKMDEVAVVRPVSSPGRIRLRPPPRCGQEIVRVEDAGISYDGERWVLRNVDLRIERGEKIAMVGLNGLGKTTLLRALAGALPLTEGRRVVGHNVEIGYQSQDFAETMSGRGTVLETVKQASPDMSEGPLRTLLGGFGFSGDAVMKRIDVLSGGERIRVAFARLLASPPNFLILDEPTTHLDIDAREALEDALCSYEGTLCLVSHDITFVRRVATGIVSMQPPGIRRWPGGYDYYREKQAAEPAAQAQGPGRSDAESGSNRGADRKEQRRERARVRQELHARTKDLKKNIGRTEMQIGRFEVERDKILAALSAVAEGIDFAGLKKRLATIQGELGAYTKRWEALAVALDEIEAGYRDGEDKDEAASA